MSYPNSLYLIAYYIIIVQFSLLARFIPKWVIKFACGFTLEIFDSFNVTAVCKGDSFYILKITLSQNVG